MDLGKVKCFLLDLDGTVYVSGKLISGAAQAVNRMRGLGKVLFLTNNSSFSSQDYLLKLNNLGLNASLNEIYTSGLATISYLKSVKRTSNVFLLGTDSLKNEFIENGIGIVESNAETVVLAFDTQLTYEKLLVACRLVEKGAHYVATHPDLVCPSLLGDMPDAGSFAALIKSATGREPNVICGKPFRAMAEGVRSLVNFKPNEIIMYGDRLTTDIQFAINNGFLSGLVLSGESTMQSYIASGLRADCVLSSIAFFDK